MYLKKIIFACFSLAFFVGCQTVQSERPRYGVTVTEAVEDLLSDPAFTRKYKSASNSAKESGLERPIISFTRFKSAIESVPHHVTKRVYLDLRSELRKTDKFDVIDVETRIQMLKELEAQVDAGGKNTKTRRFGDYEVADFIVHGELDEIHHGRFLHLKISDTSQKGEIFWEKAIDVGDVIY